MAFTNDEVVMAASRYNVGTRNILTNFRHAAPSSNQRLSPITSGRGVWMGMKSGATAATDWKAWQVHGGDVAIPSGYVMPIVVNAGNTDTVATAGTLSNSDVRRYGFWTGGIGVLTQQACFGPMWAMDTTVLAGGVAAEPIGIPEIVKAAALNKVRFSSLLQGANQMLCLQAIQFGNGGTNPVYLELDSTAIEFPSKKNAAKKLVNYNGIDDAVGFTYYPGASDTIIHRSSVISSPSKYHWRIHASASASATYDFSGLSIIGAGDVQLRAVPALLPEDDIRGSPGESFLTMFLTDADLLVLAAPLKRPHAIRRWLDRVGIPYIVGPTGWPRVPAAALPDVASASVPAQNQRPVLHL